MGVWLVVGMWRGIRGGAGGGDGKGDGEGGDDRDVVRGGRRDMLRVWLVMGWCGCARGGAWGRAAEEAEVGQLGMGANGGSDGLGGTCWEYE